jgi:hypothetical protein
MNKQTFKINTNPLYSSNIQLLTLGINDGLFLLNR